MKSARAVDKLHRTQAELMERAAASTGSSQMIRVTAGDSNPNSPLMGIGAAERCRSMNHFSTSELRILSVESQSGQTERE